MYNSVKSPEVIMCEAIEDSGVDTETALGAAKEAARRLALSLDLLTNKTERPVIWSVKGRLDWATWHTKSKGKPARAAGEG